MHRSRKVFRKFVIKRRLRLQRRMRTRTRNLRANENGKVNVNVNLVGLERFATRGRTGVAHRAGTLLIFESSCAIVLLDSGVVSVPTKKLEMSHV